MEPARRPDRPYAHRPRPPHRGDEPERRRPALPDRRLAGRGSDVEPERPHRPILPYRQEFRPDLDLAGRLDGSQPSPAAHSGGRVGPGLGTGITLIALSPCIGASGDPRNAIDLTGEKE